MAEPSTGTPGLPPPAQRPSPGLSFPALEGGGGNEPRNRLSQSTLSRWALPTPWEGEAGTVSILQTRKLRQAALRALAQGHPTPRNPRLDWNSPPGAPKGLAESWCPWLRSNSDPARLLRLPGLGEGGPPSSDGAVTIPSSVPEVFVYLVGRV